jgi:hypothetical protein
VNVCYDEMNARQVEIEGNFYTHATVRFAAIKFDIHPIERYQRLVV